MVFRPTALASPVALFLGIQAAACGPMAEEDVDVHVNAIRDKDAAWQRAAARRDLDGMMAIYAEDAEELLPGMDRLVGHDAIREFYRTLLDQFPRFSHDYTAADTHVAASGDLAVVRGTYRFVPDTLQPADFEMGKFVGVWRHRSTGWLLQINISNSNAPTDTL